MGKFFHMDHSSIKSGFHRAEGLIRDRPEFARLVEKCLTAIKSGDMSAVKNKIEVNRSNDPNRLAAIEQKQPRYLGYPCDIHGETERYTKSMSCVLCAIASARKARKHKQAAIRRAEAEKLKASKYRIKNPENAMNPGFPKPVKLRGWPFPRFDDSPKATSDYGSPGRRINTAGRFGA